MIVTTGSDGASATVHTHGAQVTSWTPAHGQERLFLSTSSSFEPGAAIRGGIPVIFPQFSTMGPLPKHGFARTSEWTPVASTGPEAVFRLRDSPATRSIWPHAFDTTVTIDARGGTLAVTLVVTNCGDDPFEFTAALHSYLRVDDIATVRIAGLNGLCYRDTAANGIERLESRSELSIEGAVDRIYLAAMQPVEVCEPHRKLVATMSGFRDVVVWNPGAQGGAGLSDLEPDGFRHMVCVEAAVVGEPVRLLPGTQWAGRQRLEAL